MPERQRPPLTCRDVSKDTWPDLERLFESRGGPKACWCMVWRDPKRKGVKQALKDYVDAGTPVGLVGYLEDEPVAWCSIAPRSSHRDGLAPKLPGDGNEAVWSLSCFFVTRRYRDEGLLRELLVAAEERARTAGATVVEAYPVDPDSPSYRFCGLRHCFEREGYEPVGRAGSRRHVYRRSLADA